MLGSTYTLCSQCCTRVPARVRIGTGRADDERGANDRLHPGPGPGEDWNTGWIDGIAEMRQKGWTVIGLEAWISDDDGDLVMTVHCKRARRAGGE